MNAVLKRDHRISNGIYDLMLEEAERLPLLKKIDLLYHGFQKVLFDSRKWHEISKQAENTFLPGSLFYREDDDSWIACKNGKNIHQIHYNVGVRANHEIEFIPTVPSIGQMHRINTESLAAKITITNVSLPLCNERIVGAMVMTVQNLPPAAIFGNATIVANGFHPDFWYLEEEGQYAKDLCTTIWEMESAKPDSLFPHGSMYVCHESHLGWECTDTRICAFREILARKKVEIPQRWTNSGFQDFFARATMLAKCLALREVYMLDR